MPGFTNVNRRLLLRYPGGNPFSFNHVRTAANDESLYRLAQAIASVQADQLSRVTTVLTRRFTIG